VWSSALLEGVSPSPARVFFGVLQSGEEVILRADPDGADLIEVEMGQVVLRAREESGLWAAEMEAACNPYSEEAAPWS
jgi:hypothetical protein